MLDMLEDKSGNHHEQIGSSSNSFPPASQAIHNMLAYDIKPSFLILPGSAHWQSCWWGIDIR